MPWDFPGGAVVKNTLFNAGDMGLIPGWGTKIPHAAGPLSLRPATTEDFELWNLCSARREPAL